MNKQVTFSVFKNSNKNYSGLKHLMVPVYE